MTTAEQIRARLASMTDEEKAAALDRLRRAIFEPTDEEIAAEIDAMTDEEIDAELRADGNDPDAWAAEVRARVEAARGHACGQALSDDGTTEGA